MATLPVEVVYGSSNDPSRPPACAISTKSFWITTGMFPQSLVIRLLKPALAARIRLSAISVGKVRIEGSGSESGDSFTQLGEAPRFGSNWESTEVSLRLSSTPLHYLRLTLENSPDSPAFSAIRGVQILAN